MKEKDEKRRLAKQEENAMMRKDQAAGLYESKDSTEDNMLQESVAAYAPYGKKQGEYTVEDYRNWPEDQRVELIDGEIIEMAGPSLPHQGMIPLMVTQFQNYVDLRNGACHVFPGPVDVQLDCDEKTMVQPDMIVMCDESKFRHFGIFGVPDFVLEIVSPSNRNHDLIRKKKKYLSAGVREYWIVDLEKDTLLVFAEDDQYATHIYPLSGKVGVKIYQDDLKIDLDRIMSRIKTLP